MADAGNMTLTYSADAVNTTRIRSNAFAWSFTVVAPESHARTHRAMYPHQRGLGQFMIQGQFLNYGEYRTFMDFLRGYAYSWLYPPSDRANTAAGITISLQRGDYSEMRIGVPIQGIRDGDHVGQIGYSSPVIFQMIQDPLDLKMFTGANKFDQSFAVMGDNYNGGAEDDTTKFFYPFSPGSENSSTQATDIAPLGGGDKGPVPPPAAAPPKKDLASQFWDTYYKANPGSRPITGLMG